ncbi:MAG: Uxx-star family glutaredoxin-like (seleno)protein [Candidatus Aenigmatarchaeota archaeon]
MPEIKVYTTTYCPYCTLAKDWLKKHGMKFTEVNVENDEAAAKEMVKKSGQRGVPVIEIDGKIVVGFDKVALAKILGVKE